MGAPKITDKRWTIDLEKRIQESHYDDNPNRYSFDSNSDKELFIMSMHVSVSYDMRLLNMN